MKFVFRSGLLKLLPAVLLLFIWLTGCDKKEPVHTGCDGYTGKITDPSAERLVKKCHFITADSIEVWTARYQEYKKRNGNESTQGIGDQLGDSSSFNSCIIRKILCNENCIGLRVIYGMSSDMKIHVIIAGIKPDYSTLYINEDEACCTGDNRSLQTGRSDPPNTKPGAAEYGQMP